jgi:hypothetical protein
MCGRCGRELVQGDPVLNIDVTGRGGRVLHRCDQCEGPAPPGLPAFIERTNTITPTPLTRFAPLLPLGTRLADFRARQSGEREPGEDG